METGSRDESAWTSTGNIPVGRCEGPEGPRLGLRGVGGEDEDVVGVAVEGNAVAGLGNEVVDQA